MLQRRDDDASGGSRRVSLDKIDKPQTNQKTLKTHEAAPTKRRRSAQTSATISPGDSQADLLKSDVMQSLDTLDDIEQPPVSRHDRKAKKEAKKAKKAGKKKRKWIKWAVIGVIVAVLALGGYFAWRAWAALGSAFEGNPLNVLSNQPLKQDANGRTNILIFGDESDSQAHIESGLGTNTTDSIMVISVNQNTNDAKLYSLPRDLWVKMPESGCSVGNEAKLNAVYVCGLEQNNEDEKVASEQLRQTVAEYTGQDIQYYVKANFTLVQEAVDAVGGVTVNIESDDPRGILDRNFDWECGYDCYYVKYENGPVNLDGKHALALARARNASGGYGLDGGNFDREQYQQKIAIAVKDKAVSGGTISNPVKVSKLLDSFGKNIVTNFQTSEIQTLAKIAQKIDTNNIGQISFVDEENPIVTTGMYGDQSIVQPVAGLYDFSQLKSFLVKQLSSDAAIKENATISVYNGSDVTGAAAKIADDLAAKGLNATAVGNAPNTAGTYVIYDLTNGAKTATSEKLAKLYNVTVRAATAETLPSGVTADKDFVIIVGNDGAN